MGSDSKLYDATVLSIGKNLPATELSHVSFLVPFVYKVILLQWLRQRMSGHHRRKVVRGEGGKKPVNTKRRTLVTIMRNKPVSEATM